MRTKKNHSNGSAESQGFRLSRPRDLLGNYWTDVWRLIPDADDIPIEGFSRARNSMPVGKVKEVDEVLHWI